MFILNFNTLHKHGMAGNSLTKLWTKALSMSKSWAEIKCWKFYTGKDKTRDNEYNCTSFSRKDPCQTDKTAQVHKMATQLACASWMLKVSN